MRRLSIAVAVMVALSVPVQAATYSGFMTGAEYVKLPRSERVLYIKGVYDMMVRMCAEVYAVSPQSGAATFCRRVERCVAGKDIGELTDFIDAFMQEYPDERDAGMASTYRAAMNVKCPQYTS